jgi:hypothetical protein
MSEQDLDRERMNEAPRRFREQQDAAWLQHAQEFRECGFLGDDMMQSLVTKHQIETVVGQGNVGRVVGHQFSIDAVVTQFPLRPGPAQRVGVDPDQTLRPETPIEFNQGFAMTEADIQHARDRSRPRLQHRLEIIQCALQDIDNPRLGTQKPGSEPGFRYECAELVNPECGHSRSWFRGLSSLDQNAPQSPDAIVPAADHPTGYLSCRSGNRASLG